MNVPILREPTRANGRFQRLLVAALVLSALAGSAAAGEGSFRHGFVMRGQILESEAGSVVLCVGKQDGAAVGQVLDVIRHVRIGSRGKSAGPRFRREEVGAVKITSLVDEHYAMADVVKGAPKVNDTVELERSP
jgi:hypothetical protein